MSNLTTLLDCIRRLRESDRVAFVTTGDEIERLAIVAVNAQHAARYARLALEALENKDFEATRNHLRLVARLIESKEDQ